MPHADINVYGDNSTADSDKITQDVRVIVRYWHK